MQYNQASARKNNRYYSVQILRGFAALMVVLYHATKMVHDRMDEFFTQFMSGGSGVDVFFAISGFVIYITSVADSNNPQGWKMFLWRRIIRIVPLYWMLTALKLAIISFSPGVAQHSAVDLWHVIASFLFIPAWNAEHSPFPLLTVGWTLSYEMLFYLLFAAFLAISARPIIMVTACLLILSFIGLWRTDEWGAASMLLNPILIEFIFGMWIASITINGWHMPVKLAYIAIPLAIGILVASNMLPEELCLKFRVLLWGIPGAALLAAVLSFEKFMHSAFFAFPKLVGDASYAIYLIHGFLLPFVGIVFVKLNIHGGVWNITAIVLCVLSSLVAGIIVHLWVEKPIAKIFRRVKNGNAS